MSARGPAGIVYSAAGPAHIAEAVRAARSSLRHNSLPHVLFADDAPQERPAGLEVVPFEPTDNPYADKIANIARSPFERTIYLDTDTHVVREIGHLLRLLDRYDLAAAHAPGYRGMADPDVPAAFYELNTGVIAWRASEAAAAFLRDWRETYLAWTRDEPFAGAGGSVSAGTAAAQRASAGRAADQPAFRHCVWRSGLALYVLGPEYNLRVGEPATLVAPVRVIHGRHPDPEALAARIDERRGPRHWPRHVAWRERARRALRRRVGRGR